MNKPVLWAAAALLSASLAWPAAAQNISLRNATRGTR